MPPLSQSWRSWPVIAEELARVRVLKFVARSEARSAAQIAEALTRVRVLKYDPFTAVTKREEAIAEALARERVLK